MILINCPYCGERDQSEFSNGGEAHVARPENSENLSDKEWGEYVFYRANPKGIYKLNEKTPGLKDFRNTLKTPSGEPEVGSGNFTIKK
jgi:sarcosine oxidase subunit delta